MCSSPQASTAQRQKESIVAPQRANTSGTAVVGGTGNKVEDVLKDLQDGLLRVAIYVGSPPVDDQGADVHTLPAACVSDVKPYGSGYGTSVTEDIQHRCSTEKRQAVNDV